MRARTAVLTGLCALWLAACGDQPGAQPSGTVSEASDAVAAPVLPTDPAKLAAIGEMVFKRCAACHSIDAGGADGIGPNLRGVTGRAIAARSGYDYSAALKAKGGVWDDAALDGFLTRPSAWAPGTRMTFAGIPDAADRAAVIAYLGTQAD